MPTFTTVLFDFAWTLFAKDPESWMGGAAASIGRPLSDGEPTRLVTEFTRQLAVTALDPAHIGRDLDPTVHDAAILALLTGLPGVEPEFAAALFERYLTSYEPYIDVRETLETLRGRGIRVGVVSNFGCDIRPIFARHGLDGLVDGFTVSYEVGRVKPDPEIWRIAVGALAADPARTLMVGDHPAGDGGAVAAGITALVLPPVLTPRRTRGLHHALALAG
ncbi:HAD family hydrolase [Virgisporangium aurantiacum]|uniref:Hydrolase n=1 Tax=Virgisporangium aurantiacum TaxID=175570 RepID=A0A8J3ZB87_9ACTN|nr:HAD family hydrolase [Virgisporangium aurantiacum]GIJ58575.1 hydrolase [Virgisporangium aurantiacum]